MKVNVVTDSTSDLPAALAVKYDIAVVPAQIQFGSEVFRDGADLSSDDFYRRLQTSKSLPKTSAAPVGAFRAVYQHLSQEAESVVSIHISARLSATYDAAKVASAGIGFPVLPIDSQTASMGCGLLAILAAKAAQAGASLTEVEALVREAIPHTITFGIFGTLEYLARGGRIGRAQAFLGNLLRIHPILAIKAGEVLPVERVRTRTKAIEQLGKIVKRLGVPREMAVMHSTDVHEAERLVQCLSPIFPPARIYRARIGPVIGSHVGPGAVGLALISERSV